jgi:hypothetical protein
MGHDGMWDASAPDAGMQHAREFQIGSVFSRASDLFDRIRAWLWRADNF